MLRRNQGMISSACKTSLSLFSQMEMVSCSPCSLRWEQPAIICLYTECIPAHGFPAYQDESKGSSINNDVESMFSDMGLGGTKSNVNNELIAIKSPSVLLEVGKTC